MRNGSFGLLARCYVSLLKDLKIAINIFQITIIMKKLVKITRYAKTNINMTATGAGGLLEAIKAIENRTRVIRTHIPKHTRAARLYCFFVGQII